MEHTTMTKRGKRLHPRSIYINIHVYYLMYRTDAIKSCATRGLIRCSILIADDIVPNADEGLKKRVKFCGTNKELLILKRFKTSKCLYGKNIFKKKKRKRYRTCVAQSKSSTHTNELPPGRLTCDYWFVIYAYLYRFINLIITHTAPDSRLSIFRFLVERCYRDRNRRYCRR